MSGKQAEKFRFWKNPAHVMMWIYCGIALAGFLLLSCPFLQKAPTDPVDSLFISASAISTTGLTSVSVADRYNFAGQFLILLLIQVGGLHYMSFGSFIILSTRKKLSKMHENLIKGDFGLPDDFDIHAFMRSVIFFSVAVECVGAVFLYTVFRHHGVEHPFWNAVFHSVSAFCTAGFSLFNTSFEGFAHDPLLNAVIFSLSFLGAIGFIVVTDFWKMLTGKQKAVTFTTKIILTFTAFVISIGTLLLLVTDAFPGDASPGAKFWMALFQSMTAMTTVGFNTVPIGALSHSALFLLVILMLIGASPAGTGGGIKSTTIVAVVAQMISTLRGKVNVTLFERQIPLYRLRLASASFTFYIIVLTVGIYFLNVTESHSVFSVIFEAVSALGTVGLSMGITADLTFPGKMIVIGLMMLGRIGPLTIGLALLSERDGIDDLGWHEDVVL